MLPTDESICFKSICAGACQHPLTGMAPDQDADFICGIVTWANFAHSD